MTNETLEASITIAAPVGFAGGDGLLIGGEGVTSPAHRLEVGQGVGEGGRVAVWFAVGQPAARRGRSHPPSV